MDPQKRNFVDLVQHMFTGRTYICLLSPDFNSATEQ